MVPYHMPMPACPPTTAAGEEWKKTVMTQVMTHLGLCEWVFDGPMVLNTVRPLHIVFEHAAEAARGLIPVYTLRPTIQVPISSRQGELHKKPVLELSGYIPRDDDLYGPRAVPPPLAVVEARPQPQALPEPASTPPEPANINSLPPPAVNDDAAAPDLAAAPEDPFAGMVPVERKDPPF